MIVGVGTDLVYAPRIRCLLKRYAERFAKRILATEEYLAFTRHADPARFLAMRFAAKEACAKAFGTGFNGGLAFAHIIVDADPLGKPVLRYQKRAAELIKQYHVRASHLSLTDEKDYVAAFVVLEN